MQVYQAFPARFYFVAVVTPITKLSIQVQLGMLRLFLVHCMGAKALSAHAIAHPILKPLIAIFIGIFADLG